MLKRYKDLLRAVATVALRRALDASGFQVEGSSASMRDDDIPK